MIYLSRFRTDGFSESAKLAVKCDKGKSAVPTEPGEKNDHE